MCQNPGERRVSGFHKLFREVPGSKEMKSYSHGTRGLRILPANPTPRGGAPNRSLGKKCVTVEFPWLSTDSPKQSHVYKGPQSEKPCSHWGRDLGTDLKQEI